MSEPVEAKGAREQAVEARMRHVRDLIGMGEVFYRFNLVLFEHHLRFEHDPSGLALATRSAAAYKAWNLAWYFYVEAFDSDYSPRRPRKLLGNYAPFSRPRWRVALPPL